MKADKKPIIALSDAERFPLLNDLSLLKSLKQDAFAPRFNFESGDRLSARHLERVQQYCGFISTTNHFQEVAKVPAWVNHFVRKCHHSVPFYKNRKPLFKDQPTLRRHQIQEAPWDFVTQDAPLQDLLVYQTSGTTGPPMDVLFDPVSQACWLPQLESILEKLNIKFNGGKNSVAVALICVCAQDSTLTYASLSTYLNGSGILKINLHPGDWHQAEHRQQYLEKYNPEVLTGDPFAFTALLDLKPKIKPKAMVSSAMKLTEGLKNRLENYFQCPVLDIYSLTECRMIAYAEKGKHRAIRPDLYLEVFDKNTDKPLPDGERGELVITGGNNPFLPLIRYRTGDFCSLEVTQGIPYLLGLEARDPVLFFSRSGEMINNVDISREMTNFPLAGFTLHQQKDYKVIFRGWSDDPIQELIKNSLKKLFKEDIPIEIKLEALSERPLQKPVVYSGGFSRSI